MPGPPPKPVERKRKLGNPGQKKLAAPAQVITLPQMDVTKPDSLGVIGSKFWDDVVSVCSGWLAPSDYQLVRLCAEAMDRRAFFLRVLSEEGWSVVTVKGYPYKHPLVGQLAELETQIGKWLAALGMTPVDRTKLGVAEVQRVSKLDELRSRAGRR